ncbi:MAG: hypothetical protein AAFN11_21160 [Chloroflexota bacterium]
MAFYASQWKGNKWASIEIEPIERQIAVKVLEHIASAYDITLPPYHETFEGFYCNFVLENTNVKFTLDAWSCSLAFDVTATRDDVLKSLQRIND